MNQILQELDVQMAMKMTAAIRTYHQRYLEQRLRWLEMPFYRKLWIYLLRLKAWAIRKLKRQKDLGDECPFEIGDRVQTTEIGKAHFDDVHQTGVVDVISGEAPMIGVKVDGDDEVTWYSFSVWQPKAIADQSTVTLVCDCGWEDPHTRGAAGCEHLMDQGL